MIAATREHANGLGRGEEVHGLLLPSLPQLQKAIDSAQDRVAVVLPSQGLSCGPPHEPFFTAQTATLGEVDRTVRARGMRMRILPRVCAADFVIGSSLSAGIVQTFSSLICVGLHSGR